MSRKDKEFPLYNTGVTKPYDNMDLNKMFHTNDLEFLTTNKVDVIGRKFNWIPARRGDPPRSESDMPPLKAEYNCTNVGVKSDFPKTTGPWDSGKMWVDGTYEDAKKAIYRAEDKYDPNLKFAPDIDFDYRFNRIAQQQQVTSNIADYFQERETQRTLENMIFLQEYGLSAGEVDEVMARIKVEGAMQALKDPKRGIITQKKAFERSIVEAVKQQKDAERKRDVGDMDRREAPITQGIMEEFRGIAPGKGAIQRKAEPAAPKPPKGQQSLLARFDRVNPIKDDVDPATGAEPTGFADRQPMGGAGAGVARKQRESREPQQREAVAKLATIDVTKTGLDTAFTEVGLRDLARGIGIILPSKTPGKDALIAMILQKKGVQ